MHYKPSKQDIITGTISSVIAGVIIWFVGGVLALIYLLCTGSSFDFKELFTLKIPSWIILLIATVASAAWMILKKFKKPLPFLTIHEMQVGPFKWTWTWKFDENEKRYVIQEIKPYCPHCGQILTCDLYQRPAYQCLNGHGFNLEYSKSVDAIVHSLRNQFPHYHDIIGNPEA